ncbi:MAG: malate dehydrogenase (quinone), partial [Myxococcota bacterium]
MDEPPAVDVDVVLIGAGIMSATLGTLLHRLAPDRSIRIVERLDRAAAESSDAWNNAGTGHSAFCEPNYTPEGPDGAIPIDKAVKIASSFEVSKQLWASLVDEGALPEPAGFVTAIPHRTFVTGTAGVDFLRRRHAALTTSPLFRGMERSEDPARLADWMPLVMDGRDPGPVAATSMALGTDVNFGALTRALIAQLQRDGAEIEFHREVTGIDREPDGAWRIETRDPDLGEPTAIRARFVFIGAGGAALPLLQRSGIPEGKVYGGFPVSGQWLVCRRPEVITRHWAKVYGQASVGAPPMSVPHLDTRIIGGERALLFGPYAGFSTKFLKTGSILDLPRSVRTRNLLPMLAAGLDNLALTRYLVEQVAQSDHDRLAALRAFVPTASGADWTLEVAGQRVQVIKADEEHGGVLEFGTEVVASADGSLAALLGASPCSSSALI